MIDVKLISEGQIIEELMDFCEKMNILESNYNDRINDPEQRSGYLWEMYLAKTMYSNKKNLQRPKLSKTNTNPPNLDFFYEYDGRKIWIEAIAPKKGASFNHLPQNSDEFESGILPENEIKLRIASAIKDKMKEQIKKGISQGIISDNDYVVLAINGSEIFGNSRHFEEMVDQRRKHYMPFIVRTLFGLGEECVAYNSEGKRLIIYNGKPMVKQNGVKIFGKYFLENGTNVNGVLYSNISVLSDCYNLLGDDFIYVQNPLKENLTEEFMFCREVWIARENNVINMKSGGE